MSLSLTWRDGPATRTACNVDLRRVVWGVALTRNLHPRADGAFPAEPSLSPSVPSRATSRYAADGRFGPRVLWFLLSDVPNQPSRSCQTPIPEAAVEVEGRKRGCGRSRLAGNAHRGQTRFPEFVRIAGILGIFQNGAPLGRIDKRQRPVPKQSVKRAARRQFDVA